MKRKNHHFARGIGAGLALGWSGLAWASPVMDLGPDPSLAPLISSEGRVYSAMHDAGWDSARLFFREHPTAGAVLLSTPEWLEPTRLSLGMGGTLVLSGWDRRGDWFEAPYLLPAGGELITLDYEGKFPEGVSVPALGMGASGAVYGFGRLTLGDQPIAFDDAHTPPHPLPGIGADTRIETGLTGLGGSLVMTVVPGGTQPPRTLRYVAESWHDLGDLSESGTDGWLLVRGSRADGTMIGASAGSLLAPGEPALVHADGEIQGLGMLDGWLGAEGAAMNHSGWAVGSATVFDPTTFEVRSQAFAWHETAGLIELVDPDGAWTLLSATGISDDGWVVGIGLLDGQERAFAMQIPSPGASVLLVGILALRRRRV